MNQVNEGPEVEMGVVPGGRAAYFTQLEAVTSHLRTPFAVVDMDALDANSHDLIRRAQGLPIRVASKSVRCTHILRHVLAQSGFHGVLSFSLVEAIHLVRAGVTDDVVVAYPTTEREPLRELAHDPVLAKAITVMVDHPDHLELIDRHVGANRYAIRVCLDIDCSLKVAGLHLGVRRSPIHTPEQAMAAAAHVAARPGFDLVGVMGYEAQIAGLADSSRAVRAMKRLSVPEVRRRRAAVVAAVEGALRAAGAPQRANGRVLEFVNGGGTGSLESTATESAVTEVAAGSGLYGPHIFDHYRQFSPLPAALFALEVTRAPARGLVTVQGGGWVASGVPGPDRLPQPVWPQGLRLTRTEGAGEVQTPLHTSDHSPRIGQRVWLRHAKAGELAEHVTHLHLVRGILSGVQGGIQGDFQPRGEIVGTVPTYRAEGWAL